MTVGDFDPDWRAQSQARMAEAVARVGVPLFGVVPSWECHRSVGGFGDDSVALRHRRDGIWVEVTTALPASHRLMDDTVALVRWMTARYGFGDPIAFPVDVRVDKWEADVGVDGHAVRFVFIGDAQNWFARGTCAERFVEVDGRGMHPEELELGVVDLAEYHNPWSESRP